MKKNVIEFLLSRRSVTIKSMSKPKIGISLRVVDAPNYDEKTIPNLNINEIITPKTTINEWQKIKIILLNKFRNEVFGVLHEKHINSET